MDAAGAVYEHVNAHEAARDGAQRMPPDRFTANRDVSDAERHELAVGTIAIAIAIVRRGLTRRA